MLTVVLATVVAAALSCGAGSPQEEAQERVKGLAKAEKVDAAAVEAAIEDMDLLVRSGEHKPVYNAYRKSFRAVVDAKDALTASTDVRELARSYRTVDLLRKFAVIFGYLNDDAELRPVQDALAAAYGRQAKAAGSCVELAIAREAAALRGLKLDASVPDEMPALIPVPAELKRTAGALTVPVREVTERIVAFSDDASLPSEGYILSVTPSGVSAHSSSAAGRFYAVQTLRQLARANADDTLTFPCVEIRDFPRFGWRGVMLDESRHFFGKAAVKRILEQMARYKLNVFHWHLTDNQGWRLPVLKRPDLAPACSTRGCSGNHMDVWDVYEDRDYGPWYYTEKDIREIVRFAAERQIRIVPEVDVPGHSGAVLGTHPELGCGGKGGNVYCIGNPETLRFLDDVFDSVVELFPGETVHIGCDEVGKDGWKSCAACQAFMKEKGIGDENGLQAWVAAYVAERLAKKGRRIAGWDELAFEGTIPDGGVILEWRDGKHGGAEAVKRGHPCVLTPWSYSYFIGRQELEEDPFHYGGPQWYGPALSLEKAYGYDPLDRIPESGRALVLGGQSCSWTETTATEPELQWKMWPRTLATAEIYWSPAAMRDYADFRRRAAVHRRRLIADHVNCAPVR